MTQLRRAWGAGLGVILTLAATSFAQKKPGAVSAESLTDEQVVAAITRGVDFLIKDLDESKLPGIRKAPEKDRGNLDHISNGPGELMLESYALLHTGQELRDPRLNLRDERVQLLKDVLTQFEPAKGYDRDTYATALQALALSQLPKLPEVTAAINRAAVRMVSGMHPGGGYHYHLVGPDDGFDLSNSQYGLLGTWAAAEWGIRIPVNYWRVSDDFWRKNQLPSGQWSYRGATDQNGTPAITAAGVASLYVCADFLDRTARIDARADKDLEAGMEALAKTFDPHSDNLYYLYGMERVGLASGLKYIGKSNWYREAAAHLISRQQPNGAISGSFIESNDVRSTCYAILFLVRGRAPIVMNKLEYEGSWNARPRDSAALHSYLARIFERRLNWQVVPIDVPASEWMDAPVLYIAGSTDPSFTDEQVDKLREFVQRGGVIFSVADGGKQEFTDAMARYALRVLPPSALPAPPPAPPAGAARSAPATAPAAAASPWRVLDKDNPLYTVIGRPDPVPSILGVSNGIRELWLHSTADYGAAWQAHNENEKIAWEMPARIFMYVASKNGLHSKLQHVSLTSRPAADLPRKITMARLQFTGNWDPEPLAWPTLASTLATDSATSLKIDNVRVANLRRGEPPALAHLAGVGSFSLSEEEFNTLQDYVNKGGTLFVEAIGGDKAFASSAKALLAKLFPDARLRPVPADYLLYAGGFSPGAHKIDEVEYRKFWVIQHGAQTKPRLQFMTVGGRIGVLFSEEDITHGLLGMNTWGIDGYMPESATELARNIVLFADINEKRTAQ
jgi:hypothetical protein